MNPPLRFEDEPARHKALDLIGDISLFACSGSQGLPVAHIVAYKVHTLHHSQVYLLSMKLRTDVVLYFNDSFSSKKYGNRLNRTLILSVVQKVGSFMFFILFLNLSFGN